MSAALRMTLGVCAAGVTCLLLVGYAQAQQTGEQIKPAQYADPQTGQPATQEHRRHMRGQRTTTHFRGPDATGATAGSAPQDVDQYLASCLLIKNQAEVEIGQIAIEQSQNPLVRQFAQQMVDDHRRIAERLAQLTGTNRGTASGQYGARPQSASGDATLSKLLELDRQIARRCVSMMRDKLAEESGAEFDKCFIGAQAGAHAQMLAALEVISQQAAGPLQQVASEAKPTIQEHLKQAEQLLNELESDTESRVNRQARS